MVIKTEIISAALASVYLVQYIIMVVEFHLEVRITVCLCSEKRRQNRVNTNGALNQHLL